MTHRIVLLCCLWLGACASAPPPDVRSLFADHLFDPPSEPVADDVFAPSQAMRDFVDEAVRDAARNKGPREALLAALSSDAHLKLTYDTLYTRTATQAFEARSGNCLSLVIMAAAFAEMLDLPVQFNSVPIADSWSRSGGLYFAAGHVNLSIARAPFGDRDGHNTSGMVTIDFLPSDETRGLRKRPISRETVRAMYLNNRAAEMLAAQRLDDAYWWARRAVERVPASTLAYNTLGVIYLQRGAAEQAATVLQRALEHEPSNTSIMSNLAQALDRLGRTRQAQAMRTRLARVESQPPFYYFDLGQAALKRGDFADARRYFEREVERTADFHESHFGLAVAAFALGDFEATRKHIQLAMNHSSTAQQRNIYSAKYDHLRQRMLH